jgi:hypothetical protein
MERTSIRPVAVSLTFVFLSTFTSQNLPAQSTGTACGQVSDPSGAVVPGASLQFTGNGLSRSAKTDGQGRYTVSLPAGTYSVQANATGFVAFNRPDFNVAAGQTSPLDIALQIATETQQVQVSDQTAGQVSTDPSANAGALVLKNEDLEALPDDPDDLQADLEALAARRQARRVPSSSSMALAAGNCHRRVRSVRFVLTPIRLRLNLTGRVSVALRYSRSLAPTSSTARPFTIWVTGSSIPAIL